MELEKQIKNKLFFIKTKTQRILEPYIICDDRKKSSKAINRSNIPIVFLEAKSSKLLGPELILHIRRGKISKDYFDKIWGKINKHQNELFPNYLADNIDLERMFHACYWFDCQQKRMTRKQIFLADIQYFKKLRYKQSFVDDPDKWGAPQRIMGNGLARIKKNNCEDYRKYKEILISAINNRTKNNYSVRTNLKNIFASDPDLKPYILLVAMDN